ncbi:MAG TPA: ATP-binding cassette domain-containing protein [Kiritimatiellia bacterium]|nr:ATP-binding cassette domain-containing protein [Kiritimatiellia bacterium]HSA17506.1 ATP-binding cassette domain-containing protein [Kiritimatiellia bacterium]
MTSLAGAQSLTKHFNGVVALADFSYTVAEKEILGLLGPNGAGKTTLFNVLTGLLAPDSGDAKFKGTALLCQPVHKIANMGIARTFQNLRLIRRITVLENVLLCFKNQPGENLLNVFFRPGLCRRHEAVIREKATELLLTAGLADKANDLADNLSYGQQKLLSLLCCLAADAELLLLDEPVAGIAPEMAERILAIIADLPNQGKSAIVIEHDIDALKGIAHRMIFMDAGRKICEGVPDEVLNDPRVIEAYLD